MLDAHPRDSRTQARAGRWMVLAMAAILVWATPSHAISDMPSEAAAPADPVMSQSGRIDQVLIDQSPTRTVLKVRGSGLAAADLFELGQGTVALNFVNVSLRDGVDGRVEPATPGPVRRIDTFRSLADDGRDVRVVLDLANGAHAKLEKPGDDIVLVIEGATEGTEPTPAAPKTSEVAAVDHAPAEIATRTVEAPNAPEASRVIVAAPGSTPAIVLASQEPRSREARKALSDIEGAAKAAPASGADASGATAPVIDGETITGFFQPPSKYVGEKISIDVQDAEIQNVLRLISEISGLNLIISDEVTGRITIKLKDIPWDQVLDLILKTKNLGKEREGNIVRIAPLDILEKEQESRIRAQARGLQLEPVILKIIPVNFASASDLLAKLQQVASKRDDASIDEDKRTNSLIIKDTDRVVDVMTDLVRSLDTPTPQVLIEARIVEATLNFSRQLGIQWGTGYVASPETGNPTGLRFPNTVTVGGFPTSSSTGGTSGLGNLVSGPSGNPLIVNLPAPVSKDSGGVLGLSLQSIDDTFTLDLIISALEDSGHGKLISSPRIITIDNKEAKIEQGFDIPFRTVSEEGAQVSFQEAKLELSVTPHITPDESIVMKIKVNNDTPDFSQTVEGNPLVARKSAETEVLIRNGQTAVIGGIFQISTNINRAGVPWFHDIPVLGLFFRKDSESEQKNELIVFITPTIIKRAEG